MLLQLTLKADSTIYAVNVNKLIVRRMSLLHKLCVMKVVRKSCSGLASCYSGQAGTRYHSECGVDMVYTVTATCRTMDALSSITRH